MSPEQLQQLEQLWTVHTFEQWLYREAKLLDQIDFDAWFDLLHSDIQYVMPIRINKEGNQRPDFATDMFIFNDDIHLLKMRVDRLKTDYAWAELPPSRTKRLISNVCIDEYTPKQKASVTNYLTIYRSRGSEIEHDLISGERQDEFLYTDGQWKLVKRVFYVDQTTINTRNFAIFV